ncbi:MAG: hypothetical protein BWY99_00182 [Synergistetes bacterium ADurb.BinA166]|nr:MAG: hypothetical protein BWY99_00182 [Synergistetes bacterium ADurb.BinA166]
MALKPCKICGRLYDSARGKYCPQCLQEIDELYPKVREYIRDQKGAEYSVDSLSEEMEIDILRVQALVDLGYLDRNTMGNAGALDEEQRKKEMLAQMLKKSLSATEKDRPQEEQKKHRTYGQEIYGTRKK